MNDLIYKFNSLSIKTSLIDRPKELLELINECVKLKTIY